MGLLDDAIREHLDLKRRRGADPAEVERAEREALGPVRRNREPTDGPDEASEGQDSRFADDQGPLEDWSHDADQADRSGEPPREHVTSQEPVGDADAPADPADEGQPPAATARPVLYDDEHEQHAPERRAAGSSPEPPEPFADQPPRLGQRDRAGGETVEYDVEAAMAGEGGDEDVLEETPEFLQDTPDHDRLWFEQRPPRDFDFDG